MSISEDILVEVPENEAPLLAEMYKKHRNKCPYIHNAIMNFINWRKLGEKENIQLCSPGNSWKEDGSLFIITKLKPDLIDVVLYTLDPNGTSLLEGIVKTKRLNTDGIVQFYCVHNSLLPLVLNAINKQKWTIKTRVSADTFIMPIEKALQLNIKINPDIYIGRLNITDASIINNSWPHKYPGSESLVKMLIERNGEFGIYLRENNKLAAWCLINKSGILGTLQVLEEYKRRGFGSLITKYTALEMAKTGIQPTGNVQLGNTASKQMFLKNGFTQIEGCEVYIKCINHVNK